MEQQVATWIETIDETDVVIVQRVLSRTLASHLDRAPVRVVFDVDDALHFVRSSQLMPVAGAARVGRLAAAAYRRASRGAGHYSSQVRLVKRMAERADVVMVGNGWLGEQFARWAKRVVVVPTTVRLQADRPKVPPAGRRSIRIGWTGLKDNFVHLRLIEQAFETLTGRYGVDVSLSVVSSEPFRTTAIATQFIPWSLAAEEAAVRSFDIGIMPLRDDLFALGKCAFKAILYMANGVPVVLSPVGANRDVVEHGREGFFAADSDQWVKYLSVLIESAELRRDMGHAGLTTVRSTYSTDQSYPLLREALRLATLEERAQPAHALAD